IPVISAVGHETDFTIADFVADHRAPTPSAAAEIVAAREDQICSALEHASRQLVRLMRYRIVGARAQVQEQALSRVFDEMRGRLRNARLQSNTATPQLQLSINDQMRDATQRTNAMVQKLSPARLQMRVAAARSRFETASGATIEALESRLQSARERLALSAASLDALSPLAVLQRGYAIAQDDSGKLLRDAAVLREGDEVSVRLAKGQFTAKVAEVSE